MDVLIAIKPAYATAICNGTKRYEFRKHPFLFLQPLNDIVVMYATRPIGRIVGYFGVSRILKDSPEHLWKTCKDGAWLSELAFLQYYKTSKYSYALEVGVAHSLNPSIDPRTLFPDWSPPQSFMYISELVAQQILHQTQPPEVIANE